jgi:DNA-directed RNA polymerase subunit RPC12/RpoP
MTIYRCIKCKNVKIQTERIDDKANAICPDCKKKIMEGKIK